MGEVDLLSRDELFGSRSAGFLETVWRICGHGFHSVAFQVLADSPAVHARHREVEDEEIGMLGPGQTTASCCAASAISTGSFATFRTSSVCIESRPSMLLSSLGWFSWRLSFLPWSD